MYCAICMDQSFLITTDVIAVYLVLFIRNSHKYIIISNFLLISCTYNKISFQKFDLALISVLSIRAPTFYDICGYQKRLIHADSAVHLSFITALQCFKLAFLRLGGLKLAFFRDKAVCWLFFVLGAFLAFLRL